MTHSAPKTWFNLRIRDRFLIQPRFRVGGRLMRVVRPLLPVEMDRRIAGIVGRCGRLAPLLLLKALLAGPSFDQRPVYGEVLVAQQSVLFRDSQDFLEEGLGHVAPEQ